MQQIITFRIEVPKIFHPLGITSAQLSNHMILKHFLMTLPPKKE